MVVETQAIGTVEHVRVAAADMLEVDVPYEYQLRLARRLLAGENVLLQAPTGAGKTKGALLPYLYARRFGLSFADRLIYAVPMRTLATALCREVSELAARVDPSLQVKVQMGSQPDDPYLEADIVFTTIDQLLSAYVGSPVSLPGRNANIVGAAAIGSYIVFDEFHLLEPALALSTAIDLVSRLGQLSRVLLMSATVTSDAATLICRRTGARFEAVADSELAAMRSQATKDRRVRYVDQPLTAAAIRERHQERSIAVVNTVGRAQQLYRDLCLRDLSRQDHIRLLHARFLPEDRRATEEWALRVFREGSQEPGILVATQAIEVGLNVSAQALHTDLAPAAAIFQRAGRCARFEGEMGAVYVYALPVDETGNSQIAPYDSAEREAIHQTAARISAHPDTSFTYADERAVTEAAYATHDRRALEEVNPHNRSIQVADAMRTADPAATRLLIRDADSVSLAIHHDPTAVSPRQRLGTFSVSRRTWHALARRLLDLDQPVYALRVPERSEDGPTLPTWQRVTEKKLLEAASWVCVPPQAATYDARVGLQLGVPGTWESPVLPIQSRTLAYRNRLETYERHIALTLAHFDQQHGHYRVAGERLAGVLGLPVDVLERLARLAVALHDLAKLAPAWQEAAWRWERTVNPDIPQSGYIAHTDRDLTDQRQRGLSGSGAFRLPGHAAESAYGALPTLAALTQRLCEDGDEETVDLVQAALCCAIARHHGGEMRMLEDFELPGAAQAAAARPLGDFDLHRVPLQDRPSSLTRNQFPAWMVNPADDSLGFLLYWYVSRRLRLADQRATAEGAQ